MLEQSIYIQHISSCHLKWEKLNIFIDTITQFTAETKDHSHTKLEHSVLSESVVWFPSMKTSRCGKNHVTDAAAVSSNKTNIHCVPTKQINNTLNGLTHILTACPESFLHT